MTDLVADKGHHDSVLLAECSAGGIRTYTPELKQKLSRWVDKPAEHEAASVGICEEVGASDNVG